MSLPFIFPPLHIPITPGKPIFDSQGGDFCMPHGTILLVILAILIFFGVLHRVLDRMRLSDTAAFIIAIAMAAGTFLEFTLLRAPIQVSVNVGGFLIPLGLSIWLLATADESYEKSRAMIAAVLSALAVWGLSKMLNPEEQFMAVSPMIVFGLASGFIAALLGRSRRAAFVGAVGGLFLADVIHWLELSVTKVPGAVLFGGGGAFDAVVISGILSVGLVEFLGEAREHALRSSPKGSGSDETK